MTLNVSDRYLSELVTPRYHAGLSPRQLSALSGSSCSQISNGMSLAKCVDQDASTAQPSLVYSMHYDDELELGENDTNSHFIGSSVPIHVLQPRESLAPYALSLQRSISIADLQAGNQTSEMAPHPSGLRRTPQSIFDLRSHARYQDQSVWDHSYVESHSPTKPDLQTFSVTPRGIVGYEEKRLRRKFQYKSYQDLHILSMYQENGSLLSLNSIRQPHSATIEFSSEGSDLSESSRESSPRPHTPTCPSPLEMRSCSASDEEKLRRLNARQVHVIESRERVEESEGEIKQATVLVGPGKPRLIQIHRPSRSDHHFMHRQHDECLSNEQPITPIHDSSPVFNNYATPVSSRTHFSDISTLKSLKVTPASCRTRFSGISMLTSSKASTPDNQHRPTLSIRTNFNMHFPTEDNRPRKLSDGSSSTVFSLEDKTTIYQTDSFGSPMSRRTNTISCNTSILDSDSPKSNNLSRASTRIMEAPDEMTLTQIWRRETNDQQIISAITHTNEALDTLAARRFDLDSSVLAAFRDLRKPSQRQNIDNELTSHLSKIFPHTKSSSISTLAAWLIVNSHFVYLLSRAPANAGSSSLSKTTDDSPIKFPASFSQGHSPHIMTSSILPSRTRFSGRQASCNNHYSPPISTPMNAANIPSKAKSILGIYSQTDPAGCKARPFLPVEHAVKPPSPAHVREKAQTVHASVQTVGRKLVRDILIGKERQTLGRSAGKLGGSLGSRYGRERNNAVCNSGVEGDEIDVAVEALWEACRQITSLLLLTSLEGGL